MRHVLILILAGVLLTACSKSKLHKKLFEGEIVYIRANSAKDGLEAGSFGDVVISNGLDKTRKITNDYYYDSCPNWIDNGEKILFASKRGDDGMGLARSNYLIVYSLITHRFSNIDDKIFKINPDSKDESLDFPSANFSGKSIALSYFYDNKDYISLLNKSTNKLIKVNINDSGSNLPPSDLRTSPNGTNLIFYIYYWLSKRDISLITLKNKTIKPLIEDINEKPGSYVIGTWINNKEFSFSFNKDSVSTIKSYNIDTDSVKTLAAIHQAYVYDPVVSLRQKKIIYIVSSNYNNGDIWVYDMKTGKSDKLTNDGHAIQDIDWCESCSL